MSMRGKYPEGAHVPGVGHRDPGVRSSQVCFVVLMVAGHAADVALLPSNGRRWLHQKTGEHPSFFLKDENRSEYRGGNNKHFSLDEVITGTDHGGT